MAQRKRGKILVANPEQILANINKIGTLTKIILQKRAHDIKLNTFEILRIKAGDGDRSRSSLFLQQPKISNLRQIQPTMNKNTNTLPILK